MTTTPRKFDSEIRITESGKWLFRGQEITQENVLSFFKKNTREDELGIFITNTYAELTEHGYLEANTIFLNIINTVETDNITYLIADDDTVTPIKDFYFYSDAVERIFCMRKTDQYLKFWFNRQTHSFISNLMVEENDRYFIELEGVRIPILPYSKPIEVKIPELYRKI